MEIEQIAADLSRVSKLGVSLQNNLDQFKMRSDELKRERQTLQMELHKLRLGSDGESSTSKR